jgi:hypothetical protein
MEDGRAALASYIREGVEGPRKMRRVFQNRLDVCWPCAALSKARQQQIRAIEDFARQNGWSVTIHDLRFSATFKKTFPDGAATLVSV